MKDVSSFIRYQKKKKSNKFIFFISFFLVIFSSINAMAAGFDGLQVQTPTQLLFTAISENNPTLAGKALLAGANITVRNALLETPLQMAVDLNRVQIIFLLLPQYHLIYPSPPLVQKISVSTTTSMLVQKPIIRTVVRKNNFPSLKEETIGDTWQFLLSLENTSTSSVMTGILNGKLPLTVPPIPGFLAG